ncbi:MAG: hypothetical protein J6U54_13440 [Clostridiales bacterium]|nr:hypothetical protein [Clostridiales bacterium]
MSEMILQAKFIFSKEVMDVIKSFVQAEFMRVRNFACEALNPHYEEWNNEFESIPHTIDENDELKDWGGTEYCKFITKKMRGVLAQVNKEHPSRLVELDTDETADIIARCKFDRSITVSLVLIPVK